MIAPELLLVISAPLHALWNLCIKRTVHKTAASISVASLSVVILAIVSTLTGAWHGATWAGAPFLVGAGVAEGIYFAALARAYDRDTFGVAYTIMRGGAMFLVWGLSTAFLGETLTVLTGCGVALIFIGMVFINGWERSPSSLRDAYLSAVCIAAYHIFYGRALAFGWEAAPLFAGAMTVGCLLFYSTSKDRIREGLPLVVRANGPLVVIAACSCSASFLLFLIGLRYVPAGEAITLRNLSVLFGVLYSFLLREPIVRRQWYGMVTIALGGLLIGR